MKSPAAGLFAALLVLPAHAAVLAHYSFDTDYSDSSGNARHGTLTDTGTTGNSGIVTTAGDHVFGGGAMNFSSDRDYVDIPEASFASGLSYTIAFWARKTEGDTGDRAQWDMVIGDRNITNFFIALGDTTGPTGLRWRGALTAGNTSNRQADFAVSKDYEWHHYAIVASGTTISLYLDGEFFQTATGRQTGFTLNTIGDAYTTAANFHFHGQIDEVWVFDEALDAGTVSNLHAFNSVIPEPSVLLISTAGLLTLLRRRRAGVA